MSKRISLLMAAVMLVAGVVYFATHSSRTTHEITPVANSLKQASVSVAPKETAAATPAEIPASDNAAAPAETPQDRTADLVRQIFHLLNAAPTPESEPALKQLLADLIKSNPKAAADLVQMQSPGAERDTLLRLLAQTWAGIDFPDAIRWASTLQDGVERRSMFATVCLEAAPASPADAVDAWMSYSTEPGDTVMENLLQLWAARDEAAALAWARARPEPEAHDRAIARIAFVTAAGNPAGAAALLSEISDEPARAEATLSVLHQWATRDLPAATAWVQTFPPGPLADRAVAELAGVTQYPARRSP